MGVEESTQPQAEQRDYAWTPKVLQSVLKFLHVRIMGNSYANISFTLRGASGVIT